MTLSLSIPARLNLLGNPGDANEGDFAVLSAALDVFAHATIEADSTWQLEMRESEHGPLLARHRFDLDQLPLPYTGELDLLKGAVNRLRQHSAEFNAELPRSGFRLVTWTDVPRQSGLGGSSLFVLLALAALRAFYELDSFTHNDYVLAELTQRVEAKELNIACGFADRYVPLFGGLAYVDYRGKLQQHPLDEEPYATYERLDARANDVPLLPLMLISTGVAHDSGDVHGRMRPRYLQEQAEWEARGGALPPMLHFMSQAWETAWRGKIALLRGDWATLGALMNRNHQLVNEMMTYCGFVDGAGWANNLMIDVALENGALGAKLTGAGGGGSVVALPAPGSTSHLRVAWERTAIEHGLLHAQIYQPRIVQHGLQVAAK